MQDDPLGNAIASARAEAERAAVAAAEREQELREKQRETQASNERHRAVLLEAATDFVARARKLVRPKSLRIEHKIPHRSGLYKFRYTKRKGWEIRPYRAGNSGSQTVDGVYVTTKREVFYGSPGGFYGGLSEPALTDPRFERLEHFFGLARELDIERDVAEVIDLMARFLVSRGA